MDDLRDFITKIVFSTKGSKILYFRITQKPFLFITDLFFIEISPLMYFSFEEKIFQGQEN